MFNITSFRDWIEDALVEMPKLNKWNKVPEKLEDPGSPNELAPLAPLPRGGNDDSTLKKDLHEENFQEDVEIKNSNVSDEPVFLNTPLSDKDECFSPEDDNDEIDDFLAMEVWISQISQEISQKRTRERMSDQEAKEIKAKARENQASAFHSQLSKPAPLFVNSRATFAISES
ncbi:hypothetical protein Tco_1354801 [Tanacetum coccineum]